MITAQALQAKAMHWQSLLPELQYAAKPLVQLTDSQKLIEIDLSAGNQDLARLDVVDTAAIDAYIQKILKIKGAAGARGGYMENRLLYLRSQVFAGQEHRTLHLGVDVWLPADTAIFAPLKGIVHSFADNNNFGDYGPTIILEHQHKSLTFYSLYGHLSRQSIIGLSKGKAIAGGEKIGSLGHENENGNWPPHLHFQFMLDMEDREGDFPGVGEPSRRDYYEQLCPDPNSLIKHHS